MSTGRNAPKLPSRRDAAEEIRRAQRRCSFASSTGYLKGLPRIRKPDGSLKHIIKEGSREHVISYYGRSDGTSYERCSEPECEINRQPSDNMGDQPRATNET